MKKGKKKKLDGIPEVVATVKKESVPALQKAAIGTANFFSGLFFTYRTHFQIHGCNFRPL